MRNIGYGVLNNKMFNWLKKLIWKKDCKNCRWGNPPKSPDSYAFCVRGGGSVLFEAAPPLNFTVNDILDCGFYEYRWF